MFGPRGVSKKARVTRYLAFLWEYYGINNAYHLDELKCHIVATQQNFGQTERGSPADLVNPTALYLYQLRSDI
jgi:hypothetical protein